MPPTSPSDRPVQRLKVRAEPVNSRTTPHHSGASPRPCGASGPGPAGRTPAGPRPQSASIRSTESMWVESVIRRMRVLHPFAGRADRHEHVVPLDEGRGLVRDHLEVMGTRSDALGRPHRAKIIPCGPPETRRPSFARVGCSMPAMRAASWGSVLHITWGTLTSSPHPRTLQTMRGSRPRRAPSPRSAPGRRGPRWRAPSPRRARRCRP